MNPRLRNGLILAGVGAACALLFVSCFERRDVETSILDTLDAQRDPHFVAGEFLEKMGAELEIDRQGETPEQGSTWILPTSRIPEIDQDLIHAWTAEGGRLLLLGDRCGCTWDEVALLSEWGIVPISLESSEGGVHQVPLGGETRTLAISLSDEMRFEAPGLETHWLVDDSFGLLVVGFSVGAGEVVLVVNDTFLRNGEIGAHDHAEWLWRLAGQGRPSAAIQWTRGVHSGGAAELPGLLALLWEHARPLMVAALVLLAAWVWKRARRFGPVRPDPPPIRRRLGEHIDASGHFAWRRHRGPELLHAVRARLEHEVARHHPGWGRLSERERTTHLAAAAKLPPSAVARALRDDEIADDEAFRERIVHLERIRKAL